MFFSCFPAVFTLGSIMELALSSDVQGETPQLLSLVLFWFCLVGAATHLLLLCLGIRVLYNQCTRCTYRAILWLVSLGREPTMAVNVPRQAREMVRADSNNTTNRTSIRAFGPNSIWGPNPTTVEPEETFAASLNRGANNRGLVDLVWRRMRN